MGSNRRYGAPSERAAARKREAAAYSPNVPKVRHVWVRSSLRDDTPYPGLVIEWRRDRGTLQTSGWVAHVAYIAGENGQLIVTWVPAEHLLPVPTS